MEYLWRWSWARVNKGIKKKTNKRWRLVAQQLPKFSTTGSASRWWDDTGHFVSPAVPVWPATLSETFQSSPRLYHRRRGTQLVLMLWFFTVFLFWHVDGLRAHNREDIQRQRGINKVRASADRRTRDGTPRSIDGAQNPSQTSAILPRTHWNLESVPKEHPSTSSFEAADWTVYTLSRSSIARQHEHPGSNSVASAAVQLPIALLPQHTSFPPHSCHLQDLHLRCHTPPANVLRSTASTFRCWWGSIPSNLLSLDDQRTSYLPASVFQPSKHSRHCCAWSVVPLHRCVTGPNSTRY